MTVLVKQVLMSTLTAGLFAMSFTACSDDSDLVAENNAAENDFIAAGSNDQLQKPLGLVYTDFINRNDVQILDADTTIISVSKAYADKMGITNFVNHPMGIWQNFQELAYLRRATAQRLEGDRYILNVVPSDLVEIVQDGEVNINTGLFLDPSKAATTRSANGGGFGAQYVDNSGTIHPMAVYLQPENMTRGGSEYMVFSPEDVLCPSATRSSSIEDFFTQLIIGVVDGLSKGDTDLGVSFNTGAKCSLVKLSPTLKKDFKIECGKESGDTITIGVNCGTDFALGARVNLSVSHNKVSNFETAFTGSFAFTPKVTVGSSKKLEVPEDKATFELAPLPKIAFTIPVMGVPVPIVLNNHVDLKFNAGVEGVTFDTLTVLEGNGFSTPSIGDVTNGTLHFAGWKTPDGKLHEERWKIGGIYSPAIEKICGELEQQASVRNSAARWTCRSHHSMRSPSSSTQPSRSVSVARWVANSPSWDTTWANIPAPSPSARNSHCGSTQAGRRTTTRARTHSTSTT